MRNLIIALLIALVLPVVANAGEGAIVAREGQKRVVVIDPGHGGSDPGAVGELPKGVYGEVVRIGAG